MHLHHLTITTGHSRRSYRCEIEPDELAAARALLDSAIERGRIIPRGRVPWPRDPTGCELQATAEGRCLICTVWHDEAPLVTFGVAAHSRCGAGLWRLLCSGAQTSEHGRRHMNPERAPQEPWCAARLEPSIVLMPDMAYSCGALEPCIAWAWLDRVSV